MLYRFEWDEEKAAANQRKHQVSFTEATEAFKDIRGLEEFDDKHSTSSEDRWRRIACSQRGRCLNVIYVERADRIRIISARRASTSERERYDRGGA